MFVTIAICTWNRADILDQTLTQMANLVVPKDIQWELLVVNNNCSDNTDEILAKHKSLLPLRRLFESRQGKSYAANLAVNEARGEVIIWTDDDVMVDPEWLTCYVQAFRDWPDAAFFLGRIDPWFSQEPPAWIDRHLATLGGVYAINLGDELVRQALPSDAVAGANMAIRAAILRQFSFNENFGPVGSEYAVGEDTDVCYRIKKAGHQGVWVGTAKVRHYIRSERLTKPYVEKWFEANGALLARQGVFAKGKTLFGVPRWALWQFYKARMKSLLLSPFKKASWIAAFREASILRGALIEIRKASQLKKSKQRIAHTSF
jgi:glycosyltransferase involved in cell wall biosynthesis